MATIQVLTPLSAEFKTTGYAALTRTSDASGARTFLAFDGAADESCYWTFVAPENVATTTWTATVQFAMASATSGAVVVALSLEAVTSGDALDLDTSESLDTANTSSATTVPGTAGYLGNIVVTLTNKDSVQAGDQVRLKLSRLSSSNGGDTASGDMLVSTVRIDAS